MQLTILQLLFATTLLSTINAQNTTAPPSSNEQLIGGDTNIETGEDPASQQNNTSGDNVGNFVFTRPDKKMPAQWIKVGTTYRFQWKVLQEALPNPKVITLEWRQGAWPNVTKWTAIKSEFKNENYYDWQIPMKQSPGKYLVRVTTKERDLAWIRDGYTEQFINIYTGTRVVNGRILVDNAGQRSSGITLFRALTTIYMIVFAFRIFRQ